jgi:hypothetical protein
MLPPKKTYFATPEELHTPEYCEYVQWEASVWKANDNRNRSCLVTGREALAHRLTKWLKRYKPQ